MPRVNKHTEAYALFEKLCELFGERAGWAIIKVILLELGGNRVNIPTVKELHRLARNERIRQLFNGANHKELSINFDLSESQIRRIVQGEE